ncbi:MAG: Ldh family oxidoreductase [Pseudomonadota bacterium]|nr:Ldh family oxidoreductase [Pseudomonadota bacterium]
MPHIDPDRLRHFITDIYLAMDVPAVTAAHLADTLVAADLWGHSSHGVMRTFWYGTRIASGATRLDTEPQIITDTGPLLALDGGDGIGQQVTQHAVELAAARARQYGIAAVSIRNSGHFGTAMYFTRQLAVQNMIGFLATNASPAIPPAGGRDKLIGNNPQSWAAPTGLATPYLLDFAHSAVARGKIYLAREKGEAIPIGWALDSAGQATTDPSAAIAGTLLPMAGHKGAGLSALMDILSGLLSGSEYGGGVTGPYIADRRSGAGHFLMAIDIASLRPLDAFLADMQAMIAAWKASPPQDGVAEILYPGEPEHQHADAARAGGITLPDDVVADLVTRAAALGVDISAGDLAF